MERECLRNHGIHLVIHYDPVVTDDPELNRLRTACQTLLQEKDDRLHLHDFRMVSGNTHTNLIFDVACPFDFNLSDNEVKRQVEAIVDLLDGNYKAVVTVDRIYATGKEG